MKTVIRYIFGVILNVMLFGEVSATPDQTADPRTIEEIVTSAESDQLVVLEGAPEDPQWGHTPPIDGEATILHGLDKMTARVFAMEVKHDRPIKFGTLHIIVRGCKKNPPEEQPEAAAFIEITEQKVGEPDQQLFSGWMFASSPAVSALEHPVYDIWVTDCLPRSTSLSPQK